MNDPKTPILIWTKLLNAPAWFTDVCIGEIWHTVFVYKHDAWFRIDLPFLVEIRTDAATPEEAQAEAEQHLHKVLMDAAARLRQPNAADHVE